MKKIALVMLAVVLSACSGYRPVQVHMWTNGPEFLGSTARIGGKSQKFVLTREPNTRPAEYEAVVLATTQIVVEGFSLNITGENLTAEFNLPPGVEFLFDSMNLQLSCSLHPEVTFRVDGTDRNVVDTSHGCPPPFKE